MDKIGTIYTCESKRRYFFFLLSFIVIIALNVGCDEPTAVEGPQGPKGEQGEQGPVGPAGEDGSMIYAGKGAPADDIGKAGDYYLDQDTGALYGPKSSDGWNSNPIIV